MEKLVNQGFLLALSTINWKSRLTLIYLYSMLSSKFALQTQHCDRLMISNVC